MKRIYKRVNKKIELHFSNLIVFACKYQKVVRNHCFFIKHYFQVFCKQLWKLCCAHRFQKRELKVPILKTSIIKPSFCCKPTSTDKKRSFFEVADKHQFFKQLFWSNFLQIIEKVYFFKNVVNIIKILLKMITCVCKILSSHFCEMKKNYTDLISILFLFIQFRSIRLWLLWSTPMYNSTNIKSITVVQVTKML